LCNIAFYNKVFCWWIFWAKIIHIYIYCTTIVGEAWENNSQLDLRSNGHKSSALNSKQIWYRVTGALYQPVFRNWTGWHWWKAVIIAMANYRKEWLIYMRNSNVFASFFMQSHIDWLHAYFLRNDGIYQYNMLFLLS
jgi:hypothetical protein